MKTLIALEILGVAVVGTGIGIELGTGAHIGYVVISFGSLLIAAGGLIWGKLRGYGQ